MGAESNDTTPAHAETGAEEQVDQLESRAE